MSDSKPRVGQSPRAVVFDAAGTLFHADPGVSEVYQRHGVRFGCSLSEQMIAARFRQALARQDSHDEGELDFCTDAEREYERWQQIVAEVFVELTDTDALFQSLWRHFSQPDAWRVDLALLEIWGRLRAADLTLAIASNFDQRLHGICASEPDIATCERIFVSSEVGWRKPSPRFFRAIERELGLAGEQLLLVGDGPTNDLAGAEAVGWRAMSPEQFLYVAGEWTFGGFEGR